MSAVTFDSIRVRLARSVDTPILRQIDDDPRRESEIRHAVESLRCLVAEVDGVIAGMAVRSSLFGFDFLQLLLVSPDHRRRGVGTALVREWEAGATSPKLFTSTNESNIPMQRLCDRLGYVRSGFIENLDEEDPEIVYFKPNPRPASGPADVVEPPAPPRN